ncbi:hypothetical protein PsorP6_005412 [Peronosclerospora sorghi]|uniref:Uncharacterized protein n=1 Tax=Peronosclerospora sorghi TaxID=230839 RepID=A0ACC0W2E5_9STRA|nr:hypothetical protein PsorP6_005412 [Peronosclerospora sorghi]
MRKATVVSNCSLQLSAHAIQEAFHVHDERYLALERSRLSVPVREKQADPQGSPVGEGAVHHADLHIADWRYETERAGTFPHSLSAVAAVASSTTSARKFRSSGTVLSMKEFPNPMRIR